MKNEQRAGSFGSRVTPENGLGREPNLSKSPFIEGRAERNLRQNCPPWIRGRSRRTLVNKKGGQRECSKIYPSSGSLRAHPKRDRAEPYISHKIWIESSLNSLQFPIGRKRALRPCEKGRILGIHSLGGGRAIRARRGVFPKMNQRGAEHLVCYILLKGCTTIPMLYWVAEQVTEKSR